MMSVYFYHIIHAFKFNLYSVIVWKSGNSFNETGAVSEVLMTTQDWNAQLLSS